VLLLSWLRWQAENGGRGGGSGAPIVRAAVVSCDAVCSDVRQAAGREFPLRLASPSDMQVVATTAYQMQCATAQSLATLKDWPVLVHARRKGEEELASSCFLACCILYVSILTMTLVKRLYKLKPTNREGTTLDQIKTDRPLPPLARRRHSV
jgi:hypothetical protein